MALGLSYNFNGSNKLPKTGPARNGHYTRTYIQTGEHVCVCVDIFVLAEIPCKRQFAWHRKVCYIFNKYLGIASKYIYLFNKFLN